jgi:hypothetical protein
MEKSRNKEELMEGRERSKEEGRVMERKGSKEGKKEGLWKEEKEVRKKGIG